MAIVKISTACIHCAQQEAAAFERDVKGPQSTGWVLDMDTQCATSIQAEENTRCLQKPEVMGTAGNRLPCFGNAEANSSNSGKSEGQSSGSKK